MRVDRTPPATKRPRQQPNRAFEHNARPSAVIVGGLLLIAFVVALVLWVTMTTEGGAGEPAATTPNTSTGAGAVTAPATQSTLPPLSAAVVSSFDPDGDGDERAELVPLATDGNPATAWTTLCYDNQYLGGKNGVGLVLDLGAPRTGSLNFTLGSAPYQAKVYGAPEGAQPTSFAAWGEAVARFAGQDSPVSETVSFSTAVRYVLVSFNELAPDPGCSDSRYRGAIHELGFTD